MGTTCGGRKTFGGPVDSMGGASVKGCSGGNNGSCGGSGGEENMGTRGAGIVTSGGRSCAGGGKTIGINGGAG